MSDVKMSTEPPNEVAKYVNGLKSYGLDVVGIHNYKCKDGLAYFDLEIKFAGKKFFRILSMNLDSILDTTSEGLNALYKLNVESALDEIREMILREIGYIPVLLKTAEDEDGGEDNEKALLEMVDGKAPTATVFRDVVYSKTSRVFLPHDDGLDEPTRIIYVAEPTGKVVWNERGRDV